MKRWFSLSQNSSLGCSHRAPTTTRAIPARDRTNVDVALTGTQCSSSVSKDVVV